MYAVCALLTTIPFLCHNHTKNNIGCNTTSILGKH